jgi:hypothetical protein
MLKALGTILGFLFLLSAVKVMTVGNPILMAAAILGVAIVILILGWVLRLWPNPFKVQGE